jgi:hypothetical protein
MTTEEFVKRLKSLTPKREDFVNRGLSENYIQSLIDRYSCELKKDNSTYDDPLLRLVDSYKADKLMIGGINFGERIEETDDYYIVGEIEIDLLVVSKKSGLVKVVESDIYFDMWDCADNGSKFLDSILEAEKFFIKRSQNDDLYNNRSATDSVADACSHSAGGDRYLNFYRMLVGSW